LYARTYGLIKQITIKIVTGEIRAGAKGGQAPHFGGLPPPLLTIHITNIQFNFTFLTNSSCFQLKSTLEVLINDYVRPKGVGRKIFREEGNGNKDRKIAV